MDCIQNFVVCTNICLQAPVVSGGIYMKPATNEESLYMQIKSLKVPSISKQSIE